MRVILEVAPVAIQNTNELKITASIINDSAMQVRLNATFLAMPSVVLVVRDRVGHRVSLVPPPVPPMDEDLDWIELMPGESLSFHYFGSELFGLPLAPSTYSIQFVVLPDGSVSSSRPSDLLQSDRIQFTVI